MKKKKVFETEDYLGAVIVLENYLEGALADFEEGSIENDLCIEHSINALELLTFSMLGISSANDYRKRYEKAKAERRD